MKNIILFITAILLFNGCNESNNYTSVGIPSNGSKTFIQDTGRFDLRKIQTFYDDDSYTDTRSVYILKDKETGKEFVGISGIGISELGSHTFGKSTISDER